MKRITRILSLAAAVIALALPAGCQKDAFQEKTDLNLARCLQPTGLKATVSSTTGNVATFSWNVATDAESYILTIMDKNEAALQTLTLTPDQVPFSITLTADETYYFQVQAKNSSKGDSKVAQYVDDDGKLKSIKTYAVKDNLFPFVKERTATSIAFAWDKDKTIKDFAEVDRIEYGAPGSEDVKSYTLTADDIQGRAATIAGLTASTEYAFTLKYKSAARGQVDAWTLPDMTGFTEVSTAAALEQAIKDGANIKLTMAESPYTIGLEAGVDAPKGVKIFGEGSADAMPVIIGTITIPDAAAGNNPSYFFEGVEFNGNNTLGFAFQKANGGSAGDIKVGTISYKNCVITGYSKGIMYEWGKTLDIDEFIYESTTIYAVNADGTGGGDGFDLRNATKIGKLSFENCTIYTGFRSFIRLDSTPVIGDFAFNNNTVSNLCFVDNTNNGGLFALQTVPSSFTMKNNLFLNMSGKSKLENEATKYKPFADLGISASSNYFYNIVDGFFTTNATQASVSGKTLESDPCYNAKAGLFNIVTTSDIYGAGIGAAKWWTPYAKQPENLTQEALEGATTWDLNDAKSFSGTAKEKMVRNGIMICASEAYPIILGDGKIEFTDATPCTRKGVPTDNYLRFKVTEPGSVVVHPASNPAAHIVVATCSPVDGEANPASASVKGGAAFIEGSTAPTKIAIKDIAEETMILVYSSGALSIDAIAWSKDTSNVNTALPAPKPTASPASFTAGEATDVVVSWEAVDNADSYSAVFNKKTYDATFDESTGTWSYTIEGKTTSMLDAGSYNIDIYANPAKGDIYNTMSAAGTTSFAVLPKGGGGETELVVKSVQELNDAIAAGKTDITLAYNATPYELGTLALTAPLRLKGQASGSAYPTVKGTITLAGEIGGSVIFTNINFEGTGISESIIKEADVVTADTVAVIGGVIRNYSKALYDNSGKKASSVQYLIFDNIQVYDCSDGSDFIDMRAGAYHNLQVTRSTFARSARTFIRTDAASEINNVLVRNNTFYKVCTNSTSKDNNGLFHIRGTAGSGIQQYKIQNNLFYSILITEAPGNANGYPKFVSKNAAAIKPAAIMNNYFYNIQEDGDYSWWTVNCSKAEGTAGGGCVLPADPCKDVTKDDFTLTNGVAMNAGVGDPRWNPAGGGTPTSEITVDNANDFLTAISAGKKTITLSEGTYDLTAITEMEGLTGGVLSISNDLSLIGKGSVTFIGGFKPTGNDISKFSATGINFDGNATIGNFIDVADATVAMSSISLKNGGISNYLNRLYSQSVEATLSSLVIDGIQSYKMGTSGDCIDIRKGTASSIKVTNSTFANGIRTFLRVDAAAICSAITVKNNTFYNLCAIDSKDNNGIMHVRSTTLSADSTACRVEHNLFASMHRAEAAPAQTNGFPKLVSTASQKIFEPYFNHNYYYDIETEAGYSWWNTLKGGQATGCQGYGIVLTATPFADAASGDFTLINPLVMSENVGDPRWNPSKGGKPGDAFAVSSVEDMLTAIAAGKTNLSLAYGTYDFTTATSEAITAGALTVGSSLTLTGKAKNGKYPEIIGSFKLTATSATTSDVFTLSNLYLNGNKTLGNMIDIDPAATLGNITLRNCEVTAYMNRLVSQSGTSTAGSLDISGLLVKDMGTSGDFIDFRKGNVVMVSVTNSTFYNGIRTFLRIDAAVNCGSVNVKNNTFYNLCAVDSKDNNGIMHVRSSSLTADKVKVEKNIFAAMHRAEAAPAQTNGFPKLVSSSSQKVFEPTFRANLYFDFETDAGYSWWNTLSGGEATGTADGGAVLTETPFSADPTTGKFTVKAAYKGYGDLRW